MKDPFQACLQLVIGASLLLCTVSCSETPQGVVKKNQAALNGTLDRLSALGARFSDQPPGYDRISLPPNAPVLDVDDIGNYAYSGAANAQLFTVQDLLDPEAKTPLMHVFRSRAAWQDVRAMVKDARFAGPEQDALKALKGFAGWRYAVVIRARSVQAPRMLSQPVVGTVVDNRTFSTGSFAGGAIEGDVLLYDLESLAFLGGFPFSARSSDNVESTTYGDAAGAEGLQQWLDKDFADQIKKAVFIGLADQMPKDRIFINGNLRRRLETEKGK